MKQKITILEYNHGVGKTGSPWVSVLARVNDRVIDLRCDPKIGDLSKLVDQEVEGTFELVSYGKDKSAVIRLASVE